MADTGSSSRREFLKLLASALACGVSSDFGALAKPGTAPATKYKISPWTGDNFTIGHQILREAEYPKKPDAIESKVDVVIVGGGISGLTSAYYLRDHNVILLEQYAEAGGQSRGSSYRGIGFSYGTAYMGTNDGIYGKLYDELAIKPVMVPTTKNSWYWEGTWFQGIKASDQGKMYEQMNRLLAECKPLWAKMPNDEFKLLRGEGGTDVEALDKKPFSSFLQGYDPKFISLMDSFCKSNTSAGAQQLSALAGVMLAEDLIVPAYVFDGGNAAIARALVKKINQAGGDRIKTGTFVWDVELTSDGAIVTYLDNKGVSHRVGCKHVIVTAPPLVAGRIISNLDDMVKAKLLSYKFGSYLVANFCMKKKVFSSSYDNWVGSPFTFADVTIAETPYIATHRYKPEMGSVLTVYHPYPPGSEGRPLLFAGNQEYFASSLVSQMSKLVPQFQNNLEQVVLSRWGHAMAVPRPGSLSRINDLQKADTGSLILSHCSMHGLIPSAEAAILGARASADKVLRRST